MLSIRFRHIILNIGYDICRDEDYVLSLCLFRKESPHDGPCYLFVFECAVHSPRLFRAYNGSEYSHTPGAINSARWTGRNHEIYGWWWPAWVRVTVGDRFYYLATKPFRWTLFWLKSKQRLARRRQTDLNSAMIAAQIQDPRAPEWLIRARAMNSAGT